MKSKRTILFALVLAIVAGVLAGCVDISNVPQQGSTEPSAEESWVEASSEETVEETSVPATTKAPGTTAAATKAAATKAVTTKTAATKTDTTKAEPTGAGTTAEAKPETAAPEITTAKQAKTGAAFFDDAVFVGDSVTLGLKNTTTSQRNAGKNYLGKAKFLCSGSLSYSNCTMDLNNPKSVHPKVKGKKVYIEDGVKMLGAKKVFIMLGMNDFAAYDNNKVIQKAAALVNRIIKKSPGIQIYIESVTPITADKQHGKFNNKNVDAFNKKLQAMCAQNGWTYVDINSRFKDDKGNLNPAYCGDPDGMGIHMAKKGCDKWVNYLTETFAS